MYLVALSVVVVANKPCWSLDFYGISCEHTHCYPNKYTCTHVCKCKQRSN